MVAARGRARFSRRMQRREIETLKEQEKREAEDHALGKAMRLEGTSRSRRKADKWEGLEAGLLVEEPARSIPKMSAGGTFCWPIVLEVS